MSEQINQIFDLSKSREAAAEREEIRTRSACETAMSRLDERRSRFGAYCAWRIERENELYHAIEGATVGLKDIERLGEETLAMKLTQQSLEEEVFEAEREVNEKHEKLNDAIGRRVQASVRAIKYQEIVDRLNDQQASLEIRAEQREIDDTQLRADRLGQDFIQ